MSFIIRFFVMSKDNSKFQLVLKIIIAVASAVLGAIGGASLS